MTATLYSISVDCADAQKVASFWSQVLDRSLDPDPTAEFASIGMAPGAEGGPAWMFHQVPEGKSVKNRVHVDLVAADLPAEIDRLREIGATHLADVKEGGFVWATLADPEGNEFDVVAAP